MEIRVKVDESGPYPVVELRGDLEEGSLDHLAGHLHAVAERGHKDVIVDLSEVRAVDPVGTGTLLQLVLSIGWHEADVVLVDVRPEVRDEFERSHLARIFRFAPTQAAAVRTLDARPQL